MIIEAVVLVAAAVAGFGVGRIKNSKKLAAIQTYLSSAEVVVETDVKKVVAAIRAKL
jgi:hypothetical protein